MTTVKAVMDDGTKGRVDLKSVCCPICKGSGVLTVNGLLMGNAGQRCEMCSCEGNFPAVDGKVSAKLLLVKRLHGIRCDIACHLDIMESRVRPEGKDWKVREAIHDTQLMEADFIERLLNSGVDL